MSAPSSFLAEIDPRTDAAQPERVQLREIDVSLRGPAVLFLVAAVGWLLVATLFGLIAALKLQSPDFLGDLEWLTYGRVVPAALQAFTFGWGNNAIFAVGLWIMARLCRTRLQHLGILYVAGLFWNLGVLWGVSGILHGNLTSVEWLEMPAGIAPLLGFSYALIALWGILCFHYRQEGHVYVSQWLLLAALFWFPWLYWVAELMILWEPARGTVQSVANWWYAHNLMGLWYAPAALAAIYYVLPKVLGKPIRSYYLSLFGFWTLIMFFPWTAGQNLLYGPVPVWLQTIGVVTSMLLVVPVLIAAINHHATAWANLAAVRRSPVLHFIVFGALSYTAVGLMGSFQALRTVNVITHFTQVTEAHAFHGLYGFFAMTMFGAIYFMLPRVLDRDWPSTLLIRVHFWCGAIGVILMVGALYLGGWREGLELDNPTVPFLTIVLHDVGMNFARLIAGAIILVGELAFCLNFAGILARACCPRAAAKEGHS
jgi:cytochrome c oxidase cbb3-type subunit 1